MSKIKEYVSKFSSLSTKSVDSILDIGSLMLDAKTELQQTEYESFLSAIKYDNKSSSVRKWQVIGKSRTKLEMYKDRIPPMWSTIYALAELDPKVLEELVTNDVLKSSMTAKELKSALTPRLREKKSYSIHIKFSEDVDSSDVQTVIETMTDLKKTLTFEMTISSDLQTLIANSSMSIPTPIKLVA
jgi:hypothetical protein